MFENKKAKGRESKMNVYLLYSMNITINNVDNFCNELKQVLEEQLKITFDEKQQELRLVRNIASPDNYLQLVVVSQTNGISNLTKRSEYIKDKIINLLHNDQGNTCEYKILFKMDPDFVLQNPAEENMGGKQSVKVEDELALDERMESYIPENPSYDFDVVVLSDDVRARLREAINTIKFWNKIFDDWGLTEIEPNPSSAINLFGAPGTGKTMAAEALAKELGKRIIKVDCAKIESKYYGETSKNIVAAFGAAEKNDAVLFFDEADAFLSKRSSSDSSGTSRAHNSSRSQMITCLDKFKGLVIFATNFVDVYDDAIKSRLTNILIPIPDKDSREKIWKKHVLKRGKLNIPLKGNIDFLLLAEKYEFVGREIKKAVISACLKAACRGDGEDKVSMQDLVLACEDICTEKNNIKNSVDDKGTGKKLPDFLQKKISNNEVKEFSVKDMEDTGNIDGAIQLSRKM